MPLSYQQSCYGLKNLWHNLFLDVRIATELLFHSPTQALVYPVIVCGKVLWYAIHHSKWQKNQCNVWKVRDLFNINHHLTHHRPDHFCYSIDKELRKGCQLRVTLF